MQFDQLPPGHTGIAQKTLYTLNDNQKRSFMTYDYMKMYINGNSPWITPQETDVEFFLKFGLGEDFYEITQPIYNGWDEDDGRNSIKVDLDWLTSLKQSETSGVKIHDTDLIKDSADVRQYIYTDKEGLKTGKRIKIKGKPDLNRMQ